MIEIIVLIIVVAILVISALTGYQSWNGTICPVIPSCPPCPPCSSAGGSSPSGSSGRGDCTTENGNLKEMVRYLTLVIKKYEAEQELYKLSNGYHQVYNSPKMEYLRIEIARTIARIKKDQNTAAYFEQNLSNVI
jgi:hypothetical protein